MSKPALIFESLNCRLCHRPFSKTKEGPNAAFMIECLRSYTLCKSCIETERTLPRVERSHPCIAMGQDCLTDEYPAYYLYELLSNTALTLSDHGWTLVKEIEIPECPVTHESYSLSREELEPCVLNCGHTISNEASRKLRRCGPGRSSSTLQCPQCNRKVLQEDRGRFESPLKGFLRELPAVMEQLDLRRKEKKDNSEKNCDECNKTNVTWEMFYCRDCQKKVCARCGFGKHKGDDVVDYMIEKAKKTIKDLTTTYGSVFPELHREINEKISAFQEETERNLENVELDHSVKKMDEYKKLFDQFEKLSEKYLGEIRAYQTSLHGLVAQMKKQK